MNDGLPWFLQIDDPGLVYCTGNFVCLDFETDTKEKGSALVEENDIVLSCWIVVQNGKIVKKAHCFGGVYEQQELIDDIKSVDFVVAQNAKFECQWLRRCGVDLHNLLIYDTMLAAWCLAGNKQEERNLEALAQRYGLAGKVGTISKLIKAGVDVRDIHPRWLMDYCHQDVDVTHNVFLAQQKEISARQVWHLVHVRNLTCSVLADIEFAGMILDPLRVSEEYLRVLEIKDRVGGELARLTGGINLNSSKQLGTYLYDVLGFEEATDHRGKPLRTDSGAKSTNASVLGQLKPRTEEQLSFLTLYKEYNKAISLLEKNLDYFKRTCDERGCKFYGQFNQNRVVSHRLSASGRPVFFNGLKKAKSVQFQNVPREYKKLFWSGDDDWVVMDCDGSQLEFRVAADLGKDKTALQEIVDGTDIHSFTRDVLVDNGDVELLSIPVEDRRQASKPHTFRPLKIAA